MIGSGQSRCCCLLLWAWFGVVDEPVGQRVPHLTLIVYVLVASSLLSRLLHIHVRSCCCSLLVGQATLSCALSLPLTISRKLEALPGARSSGPGRSLSMRCTFSPARWDPVHRRPSPLCPRLRCCTRWICRSKPPSRVLLLLPTHPSTNAVHWLGRSRLQLASASARACPIC